MSKSLSFSDALRATARLKAEAAAARMATSGSDKPRDVILKACEAVALNLQPDGFTFARSGPRLRRVQGDLTYSIPIQSDRNNIAGRRAAVWVHAGIYSAELAKARRARPMPWGGDDGPDAGLVTGGQIGNLLPQPTWMEWDFADEKTRPDEISALIGSIRQIVLPFFSLFADPQAAVELLIQRPALSPASLIQYALVVVGRASAEEAGRAYLKCNPAIRDRFDAAFLQFASIGLPHYRTDYGSDLAAIAVANELDFSSR